MRTSLLFLVLQICVITSTVVAVQLEVTDAKVKINLINDEDNVGETSSSESKESNGSSTSLVTKPSLFSIEGKVFAPSDLLLDDQFLTTSRVIVNHGEFLGFIKSDGSFVVSNLPAGSYLVEVTHPDYFYEPIRVDITSKGKMRARKVNYLSASAVHQLNYPLRFKAKAPYKYFHIRETWKVTDFLFNPMVLMMVLPLLLLLVIPKMVNVADPETQREMQNMQMPNMQMPELSEMMTSLFKPGGPSNPGAASGPGRAPPKISTKKKN